MLAHALTALRLCLALPFFWTTLHADSRGGALSAACLLVALASDLLDGRVARWKGSASPAGRSFDHLTDGVFLAAGLCAAAARGALPWLLPVVLVIAFTQYVIDSLWLRRCRELVASNFGRWNVISCFAPLAADALVRMGVPALRPAVALSAWLLIGTTLLSMADRAEALLSEAVSAASH